MFDAAERFFDFEVIIDDNFPDNVTEINFEKRTVTMNQKLWDFTKKEYGKDGSN